MVLSWFSQPEKSEDVADLIAKKKYGRAIEILRGQFESGSRDPRLRMQFADALVLAGRGREAIPILVAVADEFAKDGFAAKAIAVLKKIEKIEAGRRDVEERLVSLIQGQRQTTARTPLTRTASGGFDMLRTGAFEIGMEEIGADEAAPAEAAPEPARAERADEGPSAAETAGTAPTPSPEPQTPESAGSPLAAVEAAPLLQQPVPSTVAAESDPAIAAPAPQSATPPAPEPQSGEPPLRLGAESTGEPAPPGGPEWTAPPPGDEEPVVEGPEGWSPPPAAPAAEPPPPALERSVVELPDPLSPAPPAPAVDPPVAPEAEAATPPAPTAPPLAPAPGPDISEDQFEEELLSVINMALEAPDAPLEALDPANLVEAPAEPRPKTLFDDFAEDELLAVMQGLRLLAFEPGDIIISEGEPGGSMFVLTTGTVKAFIRNPAGRHVRVRVLGEGEFFGEISILTGKPRTATVTAGAACELLELDRDSLDRITQQHPHVLEVLREFYLKRHNSADEALIRGTAPSGPPR